MPPALPRCLPPSARTWARIAKAAGVGAASLALALSANAASVKLGADGGALVFDPATITIKAGESVTWTNTRGLPPQRCVRRGRYPGEQRTSIARCCRGTCAHQSTPCLHASGTWYTLCVLMLVEVRQPSRVVELHAARHMQ